ncbi:hypothetical protein UFOVP1625_9 [uncultured Caudovirales phage]|uniref:Uncharacterized protein n=1 Tax=uncultured Caudovirales phage TaxID=2100421 RepID=A0A6J5SXT3_9CAUD|nr:hypothetical protein UFOVP1625_9 [uncultured Caudovirales phage]
MVGGLLGILGSVACFLELAGKLPIGAAGPIIGLVGGALSIFGRAKAVSKLKW